MASKTKVILKEAAMKIVASNAQSGDTLLHSLCKNANVTAAVLYSSALSTAQFVALCAVANAAGEGLFMRFLKRNRSVHAVPM